MNFKYKVRYIARIVFLLLIIISILKNNVYGFMTLNLFLAYIPLELCLLLKLFKPRRKFEWPLFVIFSLIFVFMVPNTFYMITDLIHLNQFAFNFYAGLNIIEWKYFSYLVAAVFFALYCLMLIFLEMSTFTRNMWLNRTIILIMMFLNGLGIYMGRFLRVHSVYLINEPLRIIREVFVAIFNVDTIIFVLLMVCLQLLLVLFMKGVRMAK
ncbi:DUF1361 domain-containing protein [Staphylococcus kloosii]|uniref:DUF1361 domain-containing protein n=1 Tax=Staphylococcus kloosii TaxID=29384 RepID=UPI00189E46E1|nr:DUF1361 domain-containing protein [Staphylococcus kloosii]MBF7022759.1 DUF1361 domain-containing protein [Staphylococcus kloosii]